MNRFIKCILFALLIILSGCEKNVNDTDDEIDEDLNDPRYDSVYFFELKNENAYPFEMVYLHTKEKLPDYESYKAKLNESEIILHQIADSVLVFLVPQNETPGLKWIHSPLFNNPLEINIENSPDVGNPDEYLDEMVGRILTEMESLMSDTSEVFLTYLNQHYQDVKEVADQLSSLPASDRAAAVQFLAANSRITNEMNAMMDSIDIYQLKSTEGGINSALNVAVGILGGVVFLTSTSTGGILFGAFLMIEAATRLKTGERLVIVKKAINLASYIFSQVAFTSPDFHTIVTSFDPWGQTLDMISNIPKSQQLEPYKVERHTAIKISVKPIVTSLNEDVTEFSYLADEFYNLYARLKRWVEKNISELGELPDMVNISQYYNMPDSLGIVVTARINDDDMGKHWLSIDRFPQKDKSVVVFFNSDKDDVMDFELTISFTYPQDFSYVMDIRQAKQVLNCQLQPPYKLVYAQNGAEVPDNISFTTFKTMDVKVVNSNNRPIKGFNISKMEYVLGNDAYELIVQPVTRSSNYTDAFVFDLWPIEEKQGKGSIMIYYDQTYPNYYESDSFENMTVFGRYYKELTFDFTNTFKNHFSYTIKGSTYSIPINNIKGYIRIADQQMKNLSVGSKITLKSSYFMAGTCGYEGESVYLTVTQVKYINEDANPVMLAGTLSGNVNFYGGTEEEPDPCNGTYPVSGSLIYNSGSEIYLE
jgi:hypothetical protein